MIECIVFLGVMAFDVLVVKVIRTLLFNFQLHMMYLIFGIYSLLIF